MLQYSKNIISPRSAKVWYTI